MDGRVYLEWPDGILDLGFEDQATIDKYCLLLDKTMYGTVQGALQFFKKLVTDLILVGLGQTKVNLCVLFEMGY